MTSKLINESGTIEISDNVIREIAANAAMESYGVVGLAYKSMSDGLLMLLNRDNMQKGVKVKTKNNVITIELTLILEYGIRIPMVCENIIDTVKFNVESKTGLTVDRISILIQDLNIGK